MMHSLLMRLMKEQHNNIITCLYENSCTKSLYDHSYCIPLSCMRLINILITMIVPVRPIPALTSERKEFYKESNC